MQAFSGQCRVFFLMISVLGVFTLSACTDELPVSAAPPPIKVNVHTVAERTVPIGGHYPGRTVGSKEVQIRARVEGILIRRTYTEGQAVSEGQLLFEIDAAPFEVALNRAKAQLAQANASLSAAQRRWNRAEELIKTNSISRRELDDTESDLEFAKAAVQLAEAEVQAADINLGYTRVRAPIAGVTSREEVSEGSLVGPSNSLLTTITQLDPLWINVSLPDKLVLGIREMIERGEAAFTDGKKEVEVMLGSDDLYPYLGQINFTESAIDSRTGTVQIRAIIPNPDGKLLPGQFLRVKLHGLMSLNAIVLPERAILQGAQGTYVYKVVEGNRAEIANVVLGMDAVDGVIIESGVTAGDVVVVDGVSRIQPGAVLEPSETKKPPSQAEGKVVNQEEGDTPTASESESEGSPQ
ncbi:Efflux pump periplasmic linker BepD [Zhongshania aliphaticivorans]|uniref:Efflux pump periplasmic linker BepD n=1 Tax=Zhongshania aliphaticivorans TaxID=1470434 RepID=A0A5S9NAQ8_9GAMM|nr:efflux RND transporter periplasmic adaptor subunit [Zhongshania aliphaticivorans]CAA0087048.1 Efflux pump periplasmic linker BepD [Zhongshania aliphaticivorans]CAA0113973.1 Efflux pump periplasmic linker BepD [Zhongshania aliphaticivorans]